MLLINYIIKTIIFINFFNLVYCSTDIKVSIIIPVYNNEKFLDRSIQSVLNQTLQEIEIICVDDASTDKSLEILKKYNEIDDRLKVVHIEENKGPSIARNTGINLAVGEFIGFMDSDDYINKKYFEKLYEYSKNHDIVVGIFVNSTDDINIYAHHEIFKNIEGYVYDSIFRRKFLDDNNIRFPTNVRMQEDKMFRIKCFDNSPRVFEVPDEGIYYYYIHRKGSLWSKSNKFLKNIKKKAIKETRNRNKNKKRQLKKKRNRKKDKI